VSEGVDYAFQKPHASALKAAGKTFACRYGGAGTSDKWLTSGELADLHGHGIAVVANVEGAANGMLGGYDTGARWARQAASHFHLLGMPSDRPIYLSADFDVQPGQWGAVHAALMGARDAIGAERVGIYGGRFVIARAQAENAAQWFWQTYAWSGSPARWLPGVHLQQYRNGVTIGGASCDLDRALVQDFGQWGEAGTAVTISEWHDGDVEDARCTQGGPGQAGQQRDTLLASAAGAAGAALGLLNELNSKPPVTLTDANLQRLAELLAPTLRATVEDVIGRTRLTTLAPGE
jgi:Domain of unknown function (DUF1906)